MICVFCQDQLFGSDEKKLTASKCGHVFHRDCLDEALKYKTSLCPVCKQRLLMRHTSPLHLSVPIVAPIVPNVAPIVSNVATIVPNVTPIAVAPINVNNDNAKNEDLVNTELNEDKANDQNDAEEQNNVGEKNGAGNKATFDGQSEKGKTENAVKDGLNANAVNEIVGAEISSDYQDMLFNVELNEDKANDQNDAEEQNNVGEKNGVGNKTTLDGQSEEGKIENAVKDGLNANAVNEIVGAEISSDNQDMLFNAELNEDKANDQNDAEEQNNVGEKNGAGNKTFDGQSEKAKIENAVQDGLNANAVNEIVGAEISTDNQDMDFIEGELAEANKENVVFNEQNSAAEFYLQSKNAIQPRDRNHTVTATSDISSTDQQATIVSNSNSVKSFGGSRNINENDFNARVIYTTRPMHLVSAPKEQNEVKATVCDSVVPKISMDLTSTFVEVNASAKMMIGQNSSVDVANVSNQPQQVANLSNVTSQPNRRKNAYDRNVRIARPNTKNATQVDNGEKRSKRNPNPVKRFNMGDVTCCVCNKSFRGDISIEHYKGKVICSFECFKFGNHD